MTSYIYFSNIKMGGYIVLYSKCKNKQAIAWA